MWAVVYERANTQHTPVICRPSAGSGAMAMASILLFEILTGGVACYGRGEARRGLIQNAVKQQNHFPCSLPITGRALYVRRDRLAEADF